MPSTLSSNKSLLLLLINNKPTKITSKLKLLPITIWLLPSKDNLIKLTLILNTTNKKIEIWLLKRQPLKNPLLANNGISKLIPTLKLWLKTNLLVKMPETNRLSENTLKPSKLVKNLSVSSEPLFPINLASSNLRLNSTTLLLSSKSTFQTRLHLLLLQLFQSFLNSPSQPVKLIKFNSIKLLTLLTNSLMNSETKKPLMLLTTTELLKILPTKSMPSLI